MKKTLTLLLIITSFSLSAQTAKGSFMIGGSANLSVDKSVIDDDEIKSTNFGVSPDLSYFLVNNFSIGLSVPFNRSRYRSVSSTLPTETESNSYSIGVGPVVRYYFPIKNFFLIAQGSYDWNYSKSTYDYIDSATGTVYSTDEYTVKHKGYSLGTGPAFFLSPYSSIEILANYGKSNYGSVDNSSFYITVGFQIYIPKRNEE